MYKLQLIHIFIFVPVKKLKAILSFVLTGILIFATAGFSVSRHYCMGTLVTEDFFELPAQHPDDEHFQCAGMEDHHPGEEKLLNSCCEDEVILISGIDVQSFSKRSSVLNLDFFKAFIYTFQSTGLTEVFSPVTYSLPPPDTGTRSGLQILLWVQRFLI